MNIIKILIVDDHPLFSRGLASLILSKPMYKVVAEATNSAEALKIMREEKPNLAIVDLNLGDENGLDLIASMMAIDEKLIILVLSMHDERYYSERVLRLGAKGFIMKDEAGNKVLEAIKRVLDGKIYLSKAEVERISEAATLDNVKVSKEWYASVRKLSDRQFEIFSLLGKGYGTVEIAAKLNLSTKTIDTHKEHIKLKLHCSSAQELRQLAVEWASYPEAVIS
ncbi:MAG: response regulator transcription factor [Treponema sp.]|jgi:DNA-binding NarL/FixJ family response regulator|nr:response regulator transcription factor [Treponema sp.]